MRASFLLCILFFPKLCFTKEEVDYKKMYSLLKDTYVGEKAYAKMPKKNKIRFVVDFVKYPTSIPTFVDDTYCKYADAWLALYKYL